MLSRISTPSKERAYLICTESKFLLAKAADLKQTFLLSEKPEHTSIDNSNLNRQLSHLESPFI